VTLLLPAASIVGLGFAQQQFFSRSDRPGLLVDMTLPQNATLLILLVLPALNIACDCAKAPAS
jgi:hypothetical protein